MKYFYASRFTKDDDKLVTSYGKAADQKKYGGADAEHFEGLKTVTLNGGIASFGEDNTESDYIMRSFMRSEIRQTSSTGKFALLVKSDDRWSESGFRFNQYGAANAVMKQMAPMYEAVMVVEEHNTDGIAPRSSFNHREDDPL